MLWRDKFATAAVIFLLVAILCAILGPALLGEAATKQNLRGRNAPPFSLEQGWLMILGADALGRPLLARIIVAAQNTLMIAAGAVVLSATIGAALGLVAGYGPNWLGTAIMRLADVIMSFPSLLLAVIVLYMLSPSVGNVILVLAITRIPIYLRTTRAEVLEIKERMFVQAAQVMGASSLRIVLRHILPMVIPTLVTIATLDFAFVMLAESALSFLGIGIQPPEITWGLMVAQGKQYLANAWWLAFWPGLAIILTTLSLNLLSNWLRIALDPAQRWRLEIATREASDMARHLLEVRNLSVRFHTAHGTVDAVRNVSWHVDRGETLAILGESGSGKSVSSSAIMNLIDCPPGEIVSGEVLFDGRNLLAMSAAERRAINGKRIAMIFQDPLSHLNPVYTVGWQLREVMRVHGMTRVQAEERALELMRRVGIPEPAAALDKYPHQFSGGQRQRVMIAMALAMKPDIIIADEPTTALDVTVQAEVLKLLEELQDEMGLGLVLITHDLGVVAEVADRVVVMNGGEIVEAGTPTEIYHHAKHPYTRKLIAAAPGHGTMNAPVKGAEPILKVERACKTYGTLKALNEVSFELQKGEVLAVVGESGSGKSTVAKAIVRLIEADSGKALWKGTRPLRHEPARSLCHAPRDPDGVPGPDPVAQPADVDLPDHLRGLGDPPRHPAEGEVARARRRTPGPGRPLARARPALPAPVLRRPAPAHRHRPGAGARARA